MPGSRAVADDPEMWASILGWHCWRGAAGIWYARPMGASPAAVLQAASLDTLRACIDHRNSQQCPRATQAADAAGSSGMGTPAKLRALDGQASNQLDNR